MIPARILVLFIADMHTHTHRGRYFSCGVNDLSGQGPPPKGSQDETAAL